MKKTHRIWNLAATLIAILVLIGAAGRVKAYLQESEAPAASHEQRAAEERQAARGELPQAEKVGAEEPGEEEEGGPKTQVYLWVNFLLIAGAFWYLSKKQLGPFLRGRGEAIREEMRLSKEALQTATERLGVVEQKLQKMDEEIASLRHSALQEAAAERARIEQLGQADADKIARAAELEIAAASKLARQQLKSYAAELAVGLAEKRIQQSMSEDSDRVIFRSFIENLGDGHADGGPKKKGGA